MGGKHITYYQNPRLSHLFGFFGDIVPTKQDKFKPIDVIAVDEDGNETVLNNIYAKKPDKDAVLKFNSFIKSLIEENFNKDDFISMPNELEVLITVSCNKRRFYEVDVDNLAKSVLDSMNGLIFEDDSQVTSLISKKYIEPNGKIGILIGIVKITEDEKGFGSDFSLFSTENWH